MLGTPRKVDVAGGINEVEEVALARRGVMVEHRCGVGLDGDAPVPLNLELVQDLLITARHGLDGAGRLLLDVGTIDARYGRRRTSRRSERVLLPASM
jgi:hypothetical protein